MAAAPWTEKRAGPLLATRANLKEAGEHLYALQFAPGGRRLAAAFGNGAVRILDGKTLVPQLRAKPGRGFDDLPATSVKWRPPPADPDEADGHLHLAAASSAGGVVGFALDDSDPAEAFLDRAWRAEEANNETSAVDYNKGGTLLLSAGSDRAVRCYDTETRKLTATLDRGFDDGGHTRAAHTNRIFSLRWVSENFFLTAGWENPVQVWDIRTGKAERQLVGPAVSGDGVEFVPGTQAVTVVSKRDERQVQVFDYLSGREIEADSARLSKGLGRAPLLCARYSADAKTLWAASAKADMLFAIDAATGGVRAMMEGLGTVLCIEADPTDPRRAVAGGFREGLFSLTLD